jgi:hypothetical protein
MNWGITLKWFIEECYLKLQTDLADGGWNPVIGICEQSGCLTNLVTISATRML